MATPPQSPTKSEVFGKLSAPNTVPRAHRFPRRRTQSLTTSANPLWDYDVFASVRVGSFSAWDIEDQRDRDGWRPKKFDQEGDDDGRIKEGDDEHLRNVEMSVMFAPE